MIIRIDNQDSLSTIYDNVGCLKNGDITADCLEEIFSLYSGEIL